MQSSVRAVLAATCFAVTGILVACTSETPEPGAIARTFADPDLDARPMARMWFPDAAAGGDPNDLIARQINSMAETR